MSLIEVRKRSLCIETVFHEGGPPPEVPVRAAVACAIVRNPYAGRFEPNLLAFMAELRSLGAGLTNELVAALGKPRIEAYGKAAIVGVSGEMEHGAVWHEAGGWAMREALDNPRAIVPSVKAVASAGYRLMVPLHHIQTAYVRSHFSSIDVGVQDGPRPNEILFALAMATGGRIHPRVRGLSKDDVAFDERPHR